jgi:ribosomal protein S18 acetylase RimI-like enzyme
MSKKKKLKNISCRMLKQGDAEAVSELHADAFFSRDLEAIAKRVRNKSEKAMVAVNDNGTIVGYILFDMESEKGARCMYVANVGVGWEYRGCGVCSVMIPWLMARLKRYKCEYAFLSVFRDNASAQRCYKRAGFRAVDRSGMMRMEFHPGKQKSASKKQKVA